jgi:hypothetical protein
MLAASGATAEGVSSATAMLSSKIWSHHHLYRLNLLPQTATEEGATRLFLDLLLIFSTEP